jgi:hypothetical protein
MITMANESCQHIEPRRGSKLSQPFLMFLFRRFWYLLRHKGPTYIWYKLRLALSGKPKRAQAAIPDEVLNLQPGEWVQVKAEKEIVATLDPRGSLRGLVFMDEMRPYCGHAFRVHRRLERLFLEESREHRRLKNTVLLEGVMCGGAGIGCDRCCFLFWREAWLRRVPAVNTVSIASPADNGRGQLGL